MTSETLSACGCPRGPVGEGDDVRTTRVHADTVLAWADR